MKKLCILKKRNINSGSYDNIIASEKGFVKENRGSKMLPLFTGRTYFLRKDMQSVHWSTVGFISWVPTRILSREQKFS